MLCEARRSQANNDNGSFRSYTREKLPFACPPKGSRPAPHSNAPVVAYNLGTVAGRSVPHIAIALSTIATSASRVWASAAGSSPRSRASKLR